MEKMKREHKVLSRAAELFDLPADLVAGLPHVELIGNRQFYMENHRGILSYSGLCIDVNTSHGILRVKGQRLELLAMTVEELRMGGEIQGIEWGK